MYHSTGILSRIRITYARNYFAPQCKQPYSIVVFCLVGGSFGDLSSLGIEISVEELISRFVQLPFCLSVQRYVGEHLETCIYVSKTFHDFLAARFLTDDEFSMVSTKESTFNSPAPSPSSGKGAYSRFTVFLLVAFFFVFDKPMVGYGHFLLWLRAQVELRYAGLILQCGVAGAKNFTYVNLRIPGKD